MSKHCEVSVPWTETLVHSYSVWEKKVFFVHPSYFCTPKTGKFTGWLQSPLQNRHCEKRPVSLFQMKLFLLGSLQWLWLRPTDGWQVYSCLLVPSISDVQELYHRDDLLEQHWVNTCWVLIQRLWLNVSSRYCTLKCLRANKHRLRGHWLEDTYWC